MQVIGSPLSVQNAKYLKKGKFMNASRQPSSHTTKINKLRLVKTSKVKDELKNKKQNEKPFPQPLSIIELKALCGNYSINKIIEESSKFKKSTKQNYNKGEFKKTYIAYSHFIPFINYEKPLDILLSCIYIFNQLQNNKSIVWEQKLRKMKPLKNFLQDIKAIGLETCPYGSDIKYLLIRYAAWLLYIKRYNIIVSTKKDKTMQNLDKILETENFIIYQDSQDRLLTKVFYNLYGYHTWRK